MGKSLSSGSNVMRQGRSQISLQSGRTRNTPIPISSALRRLQGASSHMLERVRDSQETVISNLQVRVRSSQETTITGLQEGVHGSLERVDNSQQWQEHQAGNQNSSENQVILQIDAAARQRHDMSDEDQVIYC